MDTASNEQIRQRAFEIYQARGQEPGHEIDDWCQAERELRERAPEAHAGDTAGSIAHRGGRDERGGSQGRPSVAQHGDFEVDGVPATDASAAELPARTRRARRA